MSLKSLGFCAAIILLFSVHAPAATILISYELTPLGGSSYRYDYSVFNNGTLGTGVPIKLFDIAFDPAVYQSLLIVTPPALAADWDEMLLFSADPLPALYDVGAKTGGLGIPDGSSVSGFAVRFSWLGSGTPGSQLFYIYDVDTLELLQTGDTTNDVPEPSVLGVLGMALGFGAWKLRRRPA